MRNIKYIAILIIVTSFLIIINSEINNVEKQINKTSKSTANYDEAKIKTTMCQTSSCEAVFIRYIKNAKKSVYCAFFELNLEELIETIDNSKAEKLIILDNRNHLKRDYIIDDNRSGYMHNKFCVIDNKYVLTGSWNPTNNCQNKNDNNILEIESEEIVEIYQRYFCQLKKEYTEQIEEHTERNHITNDKNIEICFSRGGNCLGIINKYINQANESIYMIIFTATDDWLGDLLILKKQQGIEIEGVFERRLITKYSTYHKLMHHDIHIQRDCNPGTMHHKVFIIDNKITITGSFNPSNNADKNNDENMIIIKNETIAKKYLNEYLRVKELCTT